MIPWHTEGLLRALGSASMQVAIGILLLLIIERLGGRRLSPRWRYGLWLLVLLRLAIPVTPQFTGGAPDLVEAVVDWAAPEGDSTSAEELRDSGPGPWGLNAPITTHTAANSSRRTPSERNSTPHSKETPPRSAARTGAPTEIRLHPGTEPGTVPTGPSDSAPLAAGTTSDPPPRTEPGTGPGRWTGILLALWLGVALALALRTWRRERRFAQAVRAEPALDDPRLNALLDECMDRSGLEVRPTLVASSRVRTPALFGGRNPRILIPGALVAELDDQELRHVFLHELAHQRHRDVLLNGLFQGLRCAYWFHPLLPLALRRTRAAQEIVRDFEAIESARENAPLGYARTLIKLLERCPSTLPANRAVCMVHHGPTTRRRILMIADFPQRPRRTAAIGLALAGALTWATFTSATPQPSADGSQPPIHPANPNSKGPASPSEGIRVIRHRQPAPWMVALDEKLERRVSVEFEETDIFEALEFLSSSTETNIVGSTDLWDYGYDAVDLSIQDTSLRQVLGALGKINPGLDWTLHDGVVFVGIRGEIPMEFELRIYDLEPLLAPRGNEGSGEWHETLEDMIREFGCDADTWDNYPEASMMFVEETLMIRQTPSQHREIEAFLNRLLKQGEDDDSHVPAWRSDLRKQLESTRIDLHTEDESLGEIADRLSALLGVTILVYEDYREETPQLHLDDISADRALRWLARPHGLEVCLEDGVVVLREGFELETHIYRVTDLIDPTENASSEDMLDLLLVLIQDNAGTTTWDEDGVVLTYFRDLIVTHNRPEVHAEVKSLLAALRRFQGR